jgi:CRP-like cAMP-binding protein
MAIATASLDFDRFGRPSKLSAVTPELAALQSCPFFANLSPTTLQSLSASLSLRAVPRGAMVGSEGSPVSQAFVVVRGRVRCVRRAANGREIALEVFRPGDLVVDGALAPQGPSANDWEALEAATLLMIPREAFLGYLRGAPEVALGIGAQLLGRLERTKDLAVGLALSDVEGRVVSALVALGRQDGVDGPEGLLVRQRPTQQEIANQIGACRETVSRTVSDLVRRGLLTPRGRSLLLSRRLFAEAA